MRLVVYGYGEGADASGLPVDRCLRIPGARKTAAGPSFAKPALDLALVMTLRRVIRRERIDIVHAHNYEGLAVALARRQTACSSTTRTTPCRTSCRTTLGGARWATAFGATLDKALPRRANHSIAPHQRLADYLAECGCAPDAISVIAPAMAPWPAREPTPGAGQNPAILYSGNLDSYQNLPLPADSDGARARRAAGRPFARGKLATRSVSRGRDGLRRILPNHPRRVVPGLHRGVPARVVERIPDQTPERNGGWQTHRSLARAPRIRWSRNRPAS